MQKVAECTFEQLKRGLEKAMGPTREDVLEPDTDENEDVSDPPEMKFKVFKTCMGVEEVEEALEEKSFWKFGKRKSGGFDGWVWEVFSVFRLTSAGTEDLKNVIKLLWMHQDVPARCKDTRMVLMKKPGKSG